MKKTEENRENMAVYATLREHILHKEEQIVNETIYMYVTYFALFTVGSIWNQWVSLICFLDLIVFQSMINADQWSITKASLYIEVFFEKPYGDIHWEAFQHYSPFSEIYKRKMGNTIGWRSRKCGVSILSLVSSCLILFPALYSVDFQLSQLSCGAILRIVAALVLCPVTICVNLQYFPLRGFNNNNEFEVIIQDYYNKFYQTGTAHTDTPIP